MTPVYPPSQGATEREWVKLVHCQLWDQGNVAGQWLTQEVGEQGVVSWDASSLESLLSGGPLPFSHPLGGGQHWPVAWQWCPRGNVTKEAPPGESGVPGISSGLCCKLLGLEPALDLAARVSSWVVWGVTM